MAVVVSGGAKPLANRQLAQPVIAFFPIRAAGGVIKSDQRFPRSVSGEICAITGAAVALGAAVEVVRVAATFDSTVAPIAISTSRVPLIPASTVAGTSAVGWDAAYVSAGGGASLVQATAVRPEITRTIRMIIRIFFPQCRDNFQSSLSTG